MGQPRARWLNRVLEDIKKRGKSSKKSGGTVGRQKKLDTSCPIHIKQMILQTNINGNSIIIA
jgi:hypothetical protein